MERYFALIAFAPAGVAVLCTAAAHCRVNPAQLTASRAFFGVGCLLWGTAGLWSGEPVRHGVMLAGAAMLSGAAVLWLGGARAGTSARREPGPPRPR
jgi:hypothetical protein